MKHLLYILLLITLNSTAQTYNLSQMSACKVKRGEVIGRAVINDVGDIVKFSIKNDPTKCLTIDKQSRIIVTNEKRWNRLSEGVYLVHIQLKHGKASFIATIKVYKLCTTNR